MRVVRVYTECTAERELREARRRAARVGHLRSGGVCSFHAARHTHHTSKAARRAGTSTRPDGQTVARRHGPHR